MELNLNSHIFIVYLTVPYPMSKKESKKTSDFMLMFKYGTPRFGTTLKDHNEYLKQLRPREPEPMTERLEHIESKIDNESDDFVDDTIPQTRMEFPRNCTQCQKQIETSKEYENHMRACDLQHRAQSHHASERRRADHDTDLPAYYELVRQVKRLNRIVLHQQKVIQQLSVWVSSQKRKVSITEWLADNATPSTTFYDWVQSIRVTTQDIEYLYDNDYFDTVANTFRRYLPLKSLQELPIRAFEQRKGYIYVYDSGIHLRELKIRIKPVEDEEDDKQLRWYCLPVKTMKSIIERVIQMYYTTISAWIKERSHDQSNNTIRMMRMTKKMGAYSDDPNVRVMRVMNKLHTHLKVNKQMITDV